MEDNTSNSQEPLDCGISPDWKERVMASLSHREDEISSRWMEELMSQTTEGKAPDDGLNPEISFAELACQASMRTWVDRMFDLFQHFACQYNPTVEEARLKVHWLRPSVIEEALSYNHRREAEQSLTQFRGRVSTQEWSLLINGQPSRIEAFLIPNDRVLGFVATQDNWEPYLTMTSAWESGEAQWNIFEEPVLFNQLDEICMDLFSFLVRFAQGEGAANERYPRAVKSKGKTAQEVIRHPLASDTDQFFTQDTEWRPKTNSRPSSATPTRTGKSSKPSTAESPQRGTKEPSHKGSADNLSSSTHPEVLRGDSDVSVEEIFALLIRKIDQAIELAASQGADAFQSQDLTRAQAAITHSKELTAYKAKLTALISQWSPLNTQNKRSSPPG